MGAETLSGVKTLVQKATRGTLVDTGDLDPNVWFEIESVGASTALPIGEITAVFKSPDAGSLNKIALSTGDAVYPLTLEKICKTDAEVTLEEGTIDVTDDCENGYNASIFDGYKAISGTLNGFTKFDDATGELVTNVKEIMGKFFNIVEDDADGTYSVSPAKNEVFILFMCLNKDAKTDEKQNWLIVPALLTSFGTGAGLKDAQKRDLSWTKGQGYASLYIRTVGSTADEL